LNIKRGLAPSSIDVANRAAARYLDRRRVASRRIKAPPSPRLGLVIVIPSRNEPDLRPTLGSLLGCARPDCDVEVLVVVNASDEDGPSVSETNRATLRAARRFSVANSAAGLAVRFLHFPRLPARDAGVGLARKLGMDEAVDRLASAGARDGVIACLDADCRCEPDYLRAVVDHFRSNPRTPGCSVYFEHPLGGPLAATLYDGIAHYELYLRYHVRGIRQAGLPYGFHTVGSSMAVRASAYVAQGGMNRRQAGEDFYFAQKLIALGGYSDLLTTRVVPSPRVSDRVPFGTGRAMHRWIEDAGQAVLVDPPRAYRDLGRLVERVDRLYGADPADPGLLHSIPRALREFLTENGFPCAVAQIQRNTASPRTFRARFFRWFNAFRAIKYIRFASAHGYSKVSVTDAAATLLRRNHPDLVSRDPDVLALLARYRSLDRAGTT
jgi:cellulose synthase/poly-beta-1,6-N-acetylglucosamine synthase-like glycosyltransferase